MIQSRKVWMFGLAAIILFIVIVIMLLLFLERKSTDRMEIDLTRTYQNQFTLDQEWEDYGIGDPYILRHDGKYYLYVSTKDRRVGIKAWSSDNLVDWTYEGLVTEDPISTGAYAPEVIYWNGSFYMYTSPAGKGHYVLQSDKPTGPFAVMTENLGYTIDGSVFIDDDEKWYFTHANSMGIMARTMSDPYTIGNGEKLNTSLGHWTEGSMIIKRNGRYFITYTGNHVWSRGYRVNYAVSHKSPVSGYTVPENNPIIISTTDEFNGLGHSATVMGPDLDSYYIVYHNLVGRSAEGPPIRKMNLDRLVFNGDKMSVLGPTNGSPQAAPSMPAFSDTPGATPSDDKWERLVQENDSTALMSSVKTENRYTAEFNFIAENETGTSGDSSLSVLFNYTDLNNYHSVRVDKAMMKLILFEQLNGVETAIAEKSLPNGTDFAKLHTIRIEADSTGVSIFWDGLLQIEHSDMMTKTGRIGYAWPSGTNPELRYTAFSNEARGSSDAKAIKPLPGTMEAVHSVFEGNSTIITGVTPDGSDAVVLENRSDGLAFPVLVDEDGSYLLSIMVDKASVHSSVVIAIDGTKKEILLDSSLFTADADWMKVPLGLFEMEKGPQWLSIHLVKGKTMLRYVEANRVNPVLEETLVKPMSVGITNRFGGDTGWTDYDVSFDLTMDKATSEEARILLRTTNESEYKDQVKESFMGYELAFANDRIILRRMSYENSWDKASAALAFTSGQTRQITARLHGATIEVYSSDSEEPILKWTDPKPFLHGRVGLRGAPLSWTISPLTVTGTN